MWEYIQCVREATEDLDRRVQMIHDNIDTIKGIMDVN